MFERLKFNDTPQLSTDIPEDATLPLLKDELFGLVAQAQSHHHRMGQIYNLIVEQKLAQKAGYKTAREFFSQHFAELSQATLSMYGAVADAFTEPVTQRYGVTCLYLLLRYQDAAGIEVNPEQPGDTLIEVPDDKGQLSPLPFKTCTVDQMRQALRRKRKPASSKPLPPEAEARAEQYRTAVAAHFPKGRGTRVNVRLRNEKGKAVLDFRGIPVEHVHKLLEALAGDELARRMRELPGIEDVPLIALTRSGQVPDRRGRARPDSRFTSSTGGPQTAREAPPAAPGAQGFASGVRAAARQVAETCETGFHWDNETPRVTSALNCAHVRLNGASRS